MPVEVNQDLYTKAEFTFGHDGRPDYDDFCLGPLAAVVFACETERPRFQPLNGYPGVFTAMIPASGLFPPVVFSLGLLDDGELWYIYDFVVDSDYWKLIAEDPGD